VKGHLHHIFEIVGTGITEGPEEKYQN